MSEGALNAAATVRARLTAFPEALAQGARGAPPDSGPGEWTPIEVVRHLIAVEEEVWQRRIDQLRTEEHPRWRWVEPGQWLGAPAAGLEVVLASHARVRARTVRLLDALGSEGWARSGTHDTYGVLDLAGLMSVAADHDAEHLRSFARPTPQEKSAE